MSEQPGGFVKVNNVFGSIYCLQGGCIGLVTEMVSSIVMYNFGVGPRGTLCLQHFRRATK